jgi:TetR/AcrR family transcriptional repressor of lmrAB and yxaGH operons
MMSMNSITTSASLTTTRDRLIGAMLDALARKGFHGVGLTELLTMAGAPKGVMYHHFPGGKAELAVAAIESVVQQITNGLTTLLKKSSDPAQALGQWMASAQKLLSGSGFENGCPLAAIALESSPDDVSIRKALAGGFQRIRACLEVALNDAGISEASAHNLAALMVSAYEGALVQARVAGSVEVMHATTDALVQLVQSHLIASQQKGH